MRFPEAIGTSQEHESFVEIITSFKQSKVAKIDRILRVPCVRFHKFIKMS